jgi:hypothetical protein
LKTFHALLDRNDMRPSCVLSLQTYGAYGANFNPDGKDFQKSGRHPRNYSWSELMKRVFELDVLVCDRGGGRMRILCAINAPEAIGKILDCLGLPSRPPPIYPALWVRTSAIKT